MQLASRIVKGLSPSTHIEVNYFINDNVFFRKHKCRL